MNTPKQLTEEAVRHKIARQIVKARVPGYKMTNGDLNDEAHLVPDIYIDNILALITSQSQLAVNKAIMEVLERASKDPHFLAYTIKAGEHKMGYFVSLETIDAELNKLIHKEKI